MAVLIDDRSDGDERARPLKLSIRWRRVFSSPGGEYDCNGEMAVGLYFGDEPLFAPSVYDQERMQHLGLRVGEFAGESDYCQILRDIPRALKTGERVVIEDIVTPDIRIVIGPDLFAPDPRPEPDASFFDVLVLIDHGGLWHGPSPSTGGPAALLSTTRKGLEQFWRDLVAEAMDPAICDEVSKARLTADFTAMLRSGCSDQPR
jgi:hypothetical protein